MLCSFHNEFLPHFFCIRPWSVELSPCTCLGKSWFVSHEYLKRMLMLCKYYFSFLVLAMQPESIFKSSRLDWWDFKYISSAMSNCFRSLLIILFFCSRDALKNISIWWNSFRSCSTFMFRRMERHSWFIFDRFRREKFSSFLSLFCGNMEIYLISWVLFAFLYLVSWQTIGFS